jgi:hypothetical protein
MLQALIIYRYLTLMSFQDGQVSLLNLTYLNFNQNIIEYALPMFEI